MGRRIAYLDCHSGISGNMFLGGMLHAGFSFDHLQAALTSLPISGYRLHYAPFEDKGIRGVYFNVEVTDHDQPSRHLRDIQEIIQKSHLASRVQERALAIFQRLAEAEAIIHGVAVEQIHFHEVGAVDAIIDIVGAAQAVEELNLDQIYASPLPLTNGYVQMAHGLLPVPAPATLEILRRVKAPWRSSQAEGELVTPTGAAILATVARFETPAISIEALGYGFGKKRLDWPNCLRVCLGTTGSEVGQEAVERDQISVIECNLDNMSGELIGSLMNLLLSAGALDVTYTPMQMKKNRPAIQVSVICAVEDSERLGRLLLTETSTLGVRMQQMQRIKASRQHQVIETPFGHVPVKIKRMGEQIISAAPEYEECWKIAKERHLPLEEVYEGIRGAIDQWLSIQ